MLPERYAEKSPGIVGGCLLQNGDTFAPPLLLIQQMPRKATTPEEKALKQQVEDLIKSIKGNDEPKVDINRAINLFEKAQKNIAQAIAVLKGEEIVEELEPGKKRAGRPKKVVEAVDGDLFPSDSAAPGETQGTPGAPTTKKKKGIVTEPVNASE